MSLAHASYQAQLRQKQAIVNAINTTQSDLRHSCSDLDEALLLQPAFPSPPNCVTCSPSKIPRLESLCNTSLLQKTRITILATLKHLDRVKDIVLANTEEISPDDINYSNIHHLSYRQSQDSFVSDPLVLLPLKFDRVTDCEGNIQGTVTNPSNYLPTDTLPGHFCENHLPQPNVYLTDWEPNPSTQAPTCYKDLYEHNSFYCHLPVPYTTNPALPDKSNILDSNGFPYYKQLETSDTIYCPTTQEFARVISWENKKAVCFLTDKFYSPYTINRGTKRSWRSTSKKPQWNRTIEDTVVWAFGDFVISLDQQRHSKRTLAYVSPYTRALSAPFCGLDDEVVSPTPCPTIE